MGHQLYKQGRQGKGVTLDTSCINREDREIVLHGISVAST